MARFDYVFKLLIFSDLSMSIIKGEAGRGFIHSSLSESVIGHRDVGTQVA